MQLSTYHDIINRTINNNCPGYGYLKDFANAIFLHRKELNIGNVLLFLRLEVNNHSIEHSYFVDNKIFNTDCFKVIDIASQNRVIDSAKEDIMPFKNNNEFEPFHVIAIPIHPESAKEQLFGIKGVVILLSQKEMNLSTTELDHLYHILCTRKPKTLECPQVGKALKLLLSTKEKMSEVSLNDRYAIFSQALDVLANKGEEKNNIHGLRHFSFWSSDNKEKEYLYKEFDKNTSGVIVYDKTDKVINGQSYFIANFFNSYSINDNRLFKDMIKSFNYSDIESSFKNRDNYFSKIGLTKNNTSVIVIPILFDTHISVCCFFINDIFYTPFVSITLFETISDAIKQRENLINEINIKNTLDEMMEASLKYPKSIDFFREISGILKKRNEARDCLIYLKNDADTRFLLVSEEDENSSSTIHQSNEQFGDYEFYLPRNLKLNSFIRNSIYEALQTQRSICCYPDIENDDLFRSICVIIIKDANNSLCGFIILLNRCFVAKESSLYFNDLFFYNNIYLTESCSSFILFYLSYMQSNNRKDKLLKKLRHEIPDCSHVIERNITEISTNIGREYSVKRFQRLAKEILLNTRRIDSIVSFFSSIYFDDTRFLENPHIFNMRYYLNERIDLYREAAAYRGVSVRYNTTIDTPSLKVSDYYLHAITNIITNAIRYAAPGTCIWIQSDSKKISVSDIGIQIKETEMNKIFKEGYRSISAKDMNERGMGYGLYLTKRILDAYGHSIHVTCEEICKRNVFAERMVSQIIWGSLPKRERITYYQIHYLKKKLKSGNVLMP